MSQKQEPTLSAVLAAFEDRIVDAVETRLVARFTEGVGLMLLNFTRERRAASGKAGLPRASSRVPVTSRDPLNKKAPDLVAELTAERTAKNPTFPAMVKKAKRHIQMCPVPRCKERAAPVFNMVCAKHKGLPKATIKKYREQRRAAAAKTKPKK
jgi:hypothetical protein